MPKAHDAVDMVEGQIARRGIRDPRVLEAMQAIPRDRFVPESLHHQAYFDEALPSATARLFPSLTWWRS